MGYDDWMLTLIVVGITDEETRAKILAKTPASTLKETIATVRAEEKGRRGRDGLC